MIRCYEVALSVLVTVVLTPSLLAESNNQSTSSSVTAKVEKQPTTPGLVEVDGLRIEFVKHVWRGAKRTSFTLFVRSEHPVRFIRANCGIVDHEGKMIGRFPLQEHKIDASVVRRYSTSFADRWQDAGNSENAARFHIACLADEYISGATVYLQVRYEDEERKSFGRRFRFTEAKSVPKKQK